MERRNIRNLVVIVLLAGFSLACNLMSIPGQVRQIRGTAQAAVTEIQGIATEGKSLLTTAQAYVTENPGIVGTAQAYATQVPGLIQTAEAFATENPGPVETAKALATENPGLLSTMQAAISSGGSGQVPSSIPMPASSQVNRLTVLGGVIYYETTLNLKDLSTFYHDQMPAKGWSVDGDSINTSSAVVMNFHNDTQTALVSATTTSTTTQVVITVLKK